MDKEYLCRFCQPDHPKMCGPFSFGEFSYASNGHILVRVPRLADVPEWNALNESAACLFPSITNELIGALVAIPPFSMPKPAKCGHCNGTGKVSECPECDGDGEVDFENEHNEYTYECKTCDGFGTVDGDEQTCAFCDGTGKERVIKRVPIGESGFSSHYLTMIKEMGGAKIALQGETGPAYFTFDGGDGLLMPMRAA